MIFANDMRRVFHITALIALLLAAAPARVRATTLQRMTLEELAATAPVIARVRCIASESRWEQGRIWTLTHVEVREVLKGSAPRQITLRLLGGKVGGLIAKVEGVPRFVAGEEVIVFLEPSRAGGWGVVSWVQGTFRIARAGAEGEERVTQDTAGVAVFDPRTQRFERGDARKLPLVEFKARVARAVKRGRGGAR